MRETPYPAGSKPTRARLALLIAGIALMSSASCTPESGSEPGEPAAEAVTASAIAEDARAGGAEAPSMDALSAPPGWLEAHPVVSPNAQLELHWAALAEREREKNPREGGGRIWIERVEPVPSRIPDANASAAKTAKAARAWQRGTAPEGQRPSLVAGTRHRIELVFEVGPGGIDEGGLIFFQADPFWSWSAAQAQTSGAPGYTTAESPSADLELVPLEEGAVFEVRGRALKSGEQIGIVYGAGARGAQVDAYAETGAPLFLGVDAEGDGFRGWLPEPARIDIRARTAHRLIAFGPADLAPGAPLEISVALVDRIGNRAAWPLPQDADTDSTSTCPDLQFILTPIHDSLALMDTKPLTLQDACETGERKTLPLRAPQEEGTLRLRVEGLGRLEGFSAELNPIVIRESATRLVWGDLHGHSQFSDGTGTPENYFGYARDVARLDVIALTDHDHWGLRPLDESPDLLREIKETTRHFNAPGQFVTLPGYEWTNWVHGHRHVLSFDDALPFYSALDPATDRPDELWAALRGLPALTFAHHSAGEPIATNWFYRPDPVLEPVTEIVSVHGMSEAPDAPAPVRGGEPGYFVRDTLMRGDRLGFIGSGDSHDGHPGLAQIASGQAGLAGLMTRALDRPALLDALRRRHTFATNGIRPFLEVHLDQTPMGGILLRPTHLVAGAGGGGGGEADGDSQLDTLELSIRYEATAPIRRIDLIRSGRIAQIEGKAQLTLNLKRRIPALAPGEFHYVRIVQEDGGVAWSSPIFVDAAP